MRESDFTFANQVRAAAELRTPRTSRMLLGAIIFLLITGTTWAHFAILDEVKRGNKITAQIKKLVLESADKPAEATAVPLLKKLKLSVAR